MHSVRIELAKLILVGTRITYQAAHSVDQELSIWEMRNVPLGAL